MLRQDQKIYGAVRDLWALLLAEKTAFGVDLVIDTDCSFTFEMGIAPIHNAVRDELSELFSV